MWYPNRAQWCVMWIASALAFFLFLDTVPRYMTKTLELRSAIGLLWFGGLLVWQLSRPPMFNPAKVRRAAKWSAAALLLAVVGAIAVIAARQQNAATVTTPSLGRQAVDPSELSATPPKTLEDLGFEPEAVKTKR